jgi:hypothetical protein
MWLFSYVKGLLIFAAYLLNLNVADFQDSLCLIEHEYLDDLTYRYLTGQLFSYLGILGVTSVVGCHVSQFYQKPITWI